jgi:uncharacterized protein (DUF58 family)
LSFRPGRVLVILLACLAGVALYGVISPALWPMTPVVALGLAVMAFFDLVRARRQPALEAERKIGDRLALGVWDKVTLNIRHGGHGLLRLEIFDHAPLSFELEAQPATLVLDAGVGVEATYRAKPLQRGDHFFGRLEILVDSPFGFWRRRVWAAAPQEIKVLPNFQPLARYALLAVGDRLGQMGIRTMRRRGEGSEFRELREYREGDSLRQIDWKATARWQRTISRQYDEERNQQIIILLDCGRRLRAKDGELSHFDATLNAALLLGWVALRQGDAVGLATAGGSERWLPPQKGRGGLAAIVDSVYALEPSLDSMDYHGAATRLLTLQKRRALIVFFTNLRDEDTEELLPALALLRRKHLVLLASLRETVLRESLAQPLDNYAACLDVATTHTYLAARRHALEKLRRQGALVVDVEPDRLATDVVNRYLEVKKGGRL